MATVGDDIYLSGIPGLKTRNWLANLVAQPQFMFHLKHGLVAFVESSTARPGQSVVGGRPRRWRCTGCNKAI